MPKNDHEDAAPLTRFPKSVNDLNWVVIKWRVRAGILNTLFMNVNKDGCTVCAPM